MNEIVKFVKWGKNFLKLVKEAWKKWGKKEKRLKSHEDHKHETETNIKFFFAKFGNPAEHDGQDSLRFKSFVWTDLVINSII